MGFYRELNELEAFDRNEAFGFYSDDELDEYLTDIYSECCGELTSIIGEKR
jgi:hypothetical protein